MGLIPAIDERRSRHPLRSRDVRIRIPGANALGGRHGRFMTSTTRSGFGLTDLGIDAGGGDLTAAPSLDAHRQAEGSVLLSVLDFTDPARAGRREAELNRTLRERQTPFGSTFQEAHGAVYSIELNGRSSGLFQFAVNDKARGISDDLNMAAPEAHDWYLREWFAATELKQHDLIKQLGYGPQTASNLWHGVQPYRRDHIRDISALLSIEPYELLMHPEKAMALRRLRTVIAEAAIPAISPVAPETTKKRTGTSG